jgi:peroxiredoxin
MSRMPGPVPFLLFPFETEWTHARAGHLTVGDPAPDFNLLPAVLDEFGNSTEAAYTGWPDRLYLIDSRGRIAYNSKPGPFGFQADELKEALVTLLDSR